MRDNEVIQAQFSIAAHGARNAQDIKNALAELDRAEGLKIADFIAAYCREYGIDAQAPELAEYYRESTEYKAKIQADEDRHRKETALKNLAEKSGAYQNNLSRNVPSSTPEMLALGEAISKEAAVLAVDHSLKKVFLGFEDYVTRRVDYNSWEEYAPDLFHKLPFPNGTINLIGARSGGGKSSALINLARDIVTTSVPQKIESNADRAKERNKRRRVVFITREMTIEALLDRLVLSTAWDYAKETGYTIITKEELEHLDHPSQTIWETLRVKRRPSPEYTKSQYLYNLILDTYIKPALQSERLLMYDALDEESLENILLNVKTKTGAGDVILVDYVQLLPPSTTKDAEKYATADYLRARYIVTAIRKYAAENNVVFICAAQISTTAAKGQTRGEGATEADFKDSSDFGQAAHSAVILTRERSEKGEPPKLYYKCVKARSSHHLNDEYVIEWIPKYQYMGPGGEREKSENIAPSKKEVPRTTGKGETPKEKAQREKERWDSL